MSNMMWIALGAAAILVVVWRLLTPSLDRYVSRAIKEEDPGPLIAAIAAMGSRAQPDAFNHAIRQLWDAYHRALAVPVIQALVERHEDVPIAQYWLGQVQSVEPELAKVSFDAGFLEAHFDAEVAASCGKAG